MVIQLLKILTDPQETFTGDSFEAFTIFVLNYTATSTKQPRGSVQLLVVHSSLKNNDRSCAEIVQQNSPSSTWY